MAEPVIVLPRSVFFGALVLVVVLIAMLTMAGLVLLIESLELSADGVFTWSSAMAALVASRSTPITNRPNGR